MLFCAALRAKWAVLFWRAIRSSVRVALAIESINRVGKGWWRDIFWQRFLLGHFVATDVTQDFFRSKKDPLHGVGLATGRAGLQARSQPQASR